MGCRHCMNNALPDGTDMELPVLWDALRFLKEHGLGKEHLVVSGGEPTEHKAFDQVMQEIIAFGKTMLKKWWFAVVMVVVSVAPTVLLYTLPENSVSILIIIKNAISILLFLVAFAMGVYCIVRKKETSFSYAYTIYSFLIAVAYIFQLIGGGAVRWYNLFLMLGMIAIPYVMLYAVQTKE